MVLASWVGGGSVGVEKCYLPKPVRMSCSPMPVIRIIRNDHIHVFCTFKSSKDAKMVVKDGWFIVMIFFGVCWFYMFFSWISMRCGNMLGFMWFIAENLNRAECHGSWSVDTCSFCQKRWEKFENFTKKSLYYRWSSKKQNCPNKEIFLRQLMVLEIRPADIDNVYPTISFLHPIGFDSCLQIARPHCV